MILNFNFKNNNYIAANFYNILKQNNFSLHLCCMIITLFSLLMSTKHKLKFTGLHFPKCIMFLLLHNISSIKM